MLADGRIICAKQNLAGGADMYVFSLQEIPAAIEKTKLRVAIFGANIFARQQAFHFNNSSDLYEVEIVEFENGYSSTTGYDPTNIRQFINISLISNNPVDVIIEPGLLSFENYMAMGAFEDLYPYIDNDTELGGRAALLPQVLEALEFEGKLYRVAPDFYIETLVGMREVVGDRFSWTVDDLIETYNTLPEDAEIYPGRTASQILKLLLTFNIDEYIDWETGECHFDSDAFIKTLEFANRFPNTAPLDTNLGTPIYAATPKEVKEMLRLLENTTKIIKNDDIMYPIINEEAEAFFAGQKSAEEVARLIQSRVSIYISEQG